MTAAACLSPTFKQGQMVIASLGFPLLDEGKVCFTQQLLRPGQQSVTLHQRFQALLKFAFEQVRQRFKQNLVVMHDRFEFIDARAQRINLWIGFAIR